MPPISTTCDDIQAVLSRPSNGIVGIVDQLLTIARDHGLRLNWRQDHCEVEIRGPQRNDLLNISMENSVFRAILARSATVCRGDDGESLSPYGGRGTVNCGGDSTKCIRAVIANTPAEQRLELTPEPSDANGASIASDSAT